MLLIKQFLIERTVSDIAMLFFISFSVDFKTTIKAVQKFSLICFIILLDRYIMKNTNLDQVL